MMRLRRASAIAGPALFASAIAASVECLCSESCATSKNIAAYAIVT